MNDETFDPSIYLDATTTEAATRRPPLPAGSDFVGLITDVTVRKWHSNKPDAKRTDGIAYDFKIEVNLAAYPDIAIGVDKVTLTYGVMPDTKEDGKTLDWSPGRNGALRRVREALGMNNPGEVFSIRQMVGRQIRVKIKHRPYQGEVYDEVDSVAKA